MAKHSKMFQISDEMEEALGNFAGAENKAVSEVIREAVAQHIGYDLSQEPKTERPRKYATEAERKAAQSARNKARRELTNALVKAAKEGASQEQINRIIADSAVVDNEDNE